MTHDGQVNAHVDVDGLDEAERYALVERLCASLAHALADRLMVIAGRIDLHARRGERRSPATGLDDVRAEVRAAMTLLDRARRFAEDLRPPLAPTNVAGALQLALDELRPLADARRIDISAEPGSAGTAVMLPNGALLVVLRALLGFAIARCSSGTKVRIGVEVGEALRGVARVDCVIVRLLLPPGTSIPRDMAAVTDPWLAEPDGHAKARLLLALAVGNARDRGGWARIDDDAGQPAVTIHWPIEPASSARAEVSSQGSPVRAPAR